MHSIYIKYTSHKQVIKSGGSSSKTALVNTISIYLPSAIESSTIEYENYALRILLKRNILNLTATLQIRF